MNCIDISQNPRNWPMRSVFNLQWKTYLFWSLQSKFSACLNLFTLNTFKHTGTWWWFDTPVFQFWLFRCTYNSGLLFWRETCSHTSYKLFFNTMVMQYFLYSRNRSRLTKCQYILVCIYTSKHDKYLSQSA